MSSQIFTELIEQLQQKPYVDKSALQQFKNRIAQGPPYLRDEGITDHFCTFLVPTNIKARKIFLGHHKKADLWIPPGGHIDKGETPQETIRREWKEELGQYLTDERIELFDLGVLEIENPRQSCIRHYDFWHLIHCDMHSFDYESREFYDADWIDIKDACQKMNSRPSYALVMNHLSDYMDAV